MILVEISFGAINVNLDLLTFLRILNNPSDVDDSRLKVSRYLLADNNLVDSPLKSFQIDWLPWT